MNPEKPLLDWDHPDQYVDGLVWGATLDNRYIVEVQRTGADDGILCVWDHAQDGKLIHSERTLLMYGARFGPDVEDVGKWQDRGVEIVDALPKE